MKIVRFVGLIIGLLVISCTQVPTAVADPADRAGDVIRTWTGLAMDAVRESSAGDAKAARTYAMVDAAMFDAVNGIARGGQRYESAIIEPRRGTAGDPMVAAATAAHDVLTALYGDHSSYDLQLAADRSRASSATQAEKGSEWGAYVAQQVVAARENDGLTGTEMQTLPYRAGSFDGTWTSQPRHMAPFVIADPDAYVPGPPPALSSPEYADDYNEVKALGNKFNGDTQGEATYNFWALGSGRNQPAGAWLQVAQTVSADRGLSLIDTARLFALESMAMADTVAPTYETKWYYHGWRPQSAIRHGLEDDNAATDPDATWTARGGAGTGSPQYYSGHSAFSAAGAAVLAGFFCDDDITFTLDTDDTGTGQGTMPRTYTSFSQAAAEAGLSRIFGGQHFPSGNVAGLTAGRAIGVEVVSNALSMARGAHDCPR
jgi:hypothetical protein